MRRRAGRTRALPRAGPVSLTVGECTQVTCTGPLPNPVEGDDLYVIVDPDGAERECWEGNDVAVLRDVRCQFIE